MNIDKVKMDAAWKRRDMNELFHCFRQLGNFMSRKFQIKYSDRDDFESTALETAFKGIEKFNPTKGSHAFSYFYKIYYISFIYQLRKKKNGLKAKYSHISLDYDAAIRTYLDQEMSTQFNTVYSIGGKNYSQEEVNRILKENKGMSRKKLRKVLEDYVIVV